MNDPDFIENIPVYLFLIGISYVVFIIGRVFYRLFNKPEPEQKEYFEDPEIEDYRDEELDR